MENSDDFLSDLSNLNFKLSDDIVLSKEDLKIKKDEEKLIKNLEKERIKQEKNFEKERTKAILPNITTIEDAYRKKKNKEHLEKKYMYI